jgi:hypothetical protein
MKKSYWIVILCAGDEPMAMTANTAGDIARAYNSPASRAAFSQGRAREEHPACCGCSDCPL